MRIALVYDCLYPNTIGGAERWYRNLGERLAADHQIDYLTRRQWAEGDEPQAPFRVVAVSPGGGLYDGAGIQPGSGEFAYNVGPVALEPVGDSDLGVETVDAPDYRRLCGERWDWIEAYG